MYSFDVNKAVTELFENGFAYLPSIFELTQSMGVYSKIVEELDGQTYSENCPSHEVLVEEMGLRKLFAAFQEKIEDQWGLKLSLDDKYFVARHVLPGQISEAYRGHFDSHLLTIVLPVKIPASPLEKNTPRGELKALPNARTFPKSEFLNIIQKLGWKIFASKRGFEYLQKHNSILCEYFDDYRPLAFVGVNTFHGNNFVSKEVSDRLTLLCHCFDPSSKWGIGKLLRVLRNR